NKPEPLSIHPTPQSHIKDTPLEAELRYFLEAPLFTKPSATGVEIDWYHPHGSEGSKAITLVLKDFPRLAARIQVSNEESITVLPEALRSFGTQETMLSDPKFGAIKPLNPSSEIVHDPRFDVTLVVALEFIRHMETPKLYRRLYEVAVTEADRIPNTENRKVMWDVLIPFHPSYVAGHSAAGILNNTAVNSVSSNQDAEDQKKPAIQKESSREKGFHFPIFRPRGKTVSPSRAQKSRSADNHLAEKLPAIPVIQETLSYLPFNSKTFQLMRALTQSIVLNSLYYIQSNILNPRSILSRDVSTPDGWLIQIHFQSALSSNIYRGLLSSPVEEAPEKSNTLLMPEPFIPFTSSPRSSICSTITIDVNQPKPIPPKTTTITVTHLRKAQNVLNASTKAFVFGWSVRLSFVIKPVSGLTYNHNPAVRTANSHFEEKRSFDSLRESVAFTNGEVLEFQSALLKVGELNLEEKNEQLSGVFGGDNGLVVEQKVVGEDKDKVVEEKRSIFTLWKRE
ncbi:hypothetical protein HK096_009301, partial [Nowakowskiella sp. JEL0078]